MPQILGRSAEKELLERILISPHAELLAVYGRRRVGKTYLIQQFYRDKGLYFEVVGIKDGHISQQIKNFVNKMRRTFGKIEMDAFPKDWIDAFELLQNAVQNHKGSKKIILFFDELPWMATHKSDLLKAFENLWNSFLSKDRRIITVVCGSSVSWMIQKIIRNRGGLHGRLTEQIRLKPFSLKETEEFFQAKRINLERKQIIEVYMAVGGVPKYLNYVKRGLSSAQVIQQLCFHPQGPLTTEFEVLYESLFDDYQTHIRIIETLSSTRQGLTYKEIADSGGISKTGSLSKALKELIASDFIRLTRFYGNKRREAKYRLVDEYSLFYLTWIRDAVYNYDEPLSSDYWVKLHTSSAYRSWAGYTFENMCLKHLRHIVQALKLTVVAESATYWKAATKDVRGHQIDMIIDRADRCMNLCEMKFYNKEFVITKDYADKLNKRREAFREHLQSKKTLFNTLVTPCGAKKNSHYLSCIDQQLSLDDLFKNLDD